MARRAVLLVNLGTPDEATAPAVRRYLKEFLWDDRVIKRNPLWWLVLNGIVLNTRPKRVAKLYQSVWKEDSPIRSIGYAQAEALQNKLHSAGLEDVDVHLAMTYGKPSLRERLSGLLEEGYEHCLLLPLYPQYSATTTGAVYDQVADYLKANRNFCEVSLVKDYYRQPTYIRALAESVRSHWDKYGKAQKLLLSFHGIPKIYAEKGDPYQQQVIETADLLAKELALTADEYQVCFQSRFGPTEWLQPYTDKTLEAWGAAGIESVDAICPAFAADCLETLEEIAEENKEIFLHAGGKQYHYIPALNASAAHIDMFAEIVQQYLPRKPQ